jgi:hypothetical protein
MRRSQYMWLLYYTSFGWHSFCACVALPRLLQCLDWPLRDWHQAWRDLADACLCVTWLNALEVLGLKGYAYCLPFCGLIDNTTPAAHARAYRCLSCRDSRRVRWATCHASLTPDGQASSWVGGPIFYSRVDAALDVSPLTELTHSKVSVLGKVWKLNDSTEN